MNKEQRKSIHIAQIWLKHPLRQELISHVETCDLELDNCSTCTQIAEEFLVAYNALFASIGPQLNEEQRQRAKTLKYKLSYAKLWLKSKLRKLRKMFKEWSV